MHCWEFHHTAEPPKQRWSWRSLDRNDRVHAECRGRFETFMEAFADAKLHGFDQDRHLWYLATTTHQPCVKVVDDAPRKGRGRKAA
jgi:hypothetical protein